MQHLRNCHLHFDTDIYDFCYETDERKPKRSAHFLLGERRRAGEEGAT